MIFSIYFSGFELEEMTLAIVIHVTHFIVFSVLGPLYNGDKHLCCKKEKTVQNEKWKCIAV